MVIMEAKDVKINSKIAIVILIINSLSTSKTKYKLINHLKFIVFLLVVIIVMYLKFEGLIDPLPFQCHLK